MTEMIATEDDLGRVHERLVSFGWYHFAVEDRTRCAWLVHEHEDGELYATMGEGDGWQRATDLLATRGPMRPLQDLSLNYVAARRQMFGRPAAPVGEPTDKSVAELLGVSDEAMDELRKRHDRHKVMRYVEQGCRFCVGPIGGES